LILFSFTVNVAGGSGGGSNAAIIVFVFFLLSLLYTVIFSYFVRKFDTQ